MMLDRVEVRKRFLNRVLYFMFARVQIVKGVTSCINEKKQVHRILWDLDDCTQNEAFNSLRKIQRQYKLGDIIIISDKDRSYGAICNNEVTFKELLHILIDTDLIDPLYVRYAFQRHEAILRISDKVGRPIHRERIGTLFNKTNRKVNETDYEVVDYETGYIKHGIRTGDFYNDQKTV
jgi:hypothetical protein